MRVKDANVNVLLDPLGIILNIPHHWLSLNLFMPVWSPVKERDEHLPRMADVRV